MYFCTSCTNNNYLCVRLLVTWKGVFHRTFGTLSIPQFLQHLIFYLHVRKTYAASKGAIYLNYVVNIDKSTVVLSALTSLAIKRTERKTNISVRYSWNNLFVVSSVSYQIYNPILHKKLLRHVSPFTQTIQNITINGFFLLNGKV